MCSSTFSRFLSVLAFVGVCYAVPTALQERAVTALSSSDLAGFAPFTQFARAAYCPDALKTWTCGAACNANSDFQVTLTGGDGNEIQIYYVGFSPSQNSIIVAHEGTEKNCLSLLTDTNTVLGRLNNSLFPGVNPATQVHSGFRDQHAKTASTILAEVKRLMTLKNTKNVALVGHSLGGALAELDALFLTLNLPSGTAIKAVTYGTPRVGNASFASLIDSKVTLKFGARLQAYQQQRRYPLRQLSHLDSIPIVPGRFLGFSHPRGEIHILEPGRAVACSGDDNATDADCQIQSVPNIFEGNILDHLGPYEGISMGIQASSTQLYVFFAVTAPIREKSDTLEGMPVNSRAIGSYLTRSSSTPSGLLEPFVATSQAPNSTVTLCAWIADSDIQDLETSLGNWKGSVSLLITTGAKPSSTEHHQLVKIVRRLVSRSHAARSSVHLLHVDHLDAPSPNMYLNLARLFSLTDWVLMFPSDLSRPLSSQFYSQATSKDADVKKSPHLLTPGPNAYPFSQLSPLLLRNDADFWCTERMFLGVTRESDWDECLWQLALQRNGKVDTIALSHELVTLKKVQVQIANEDVGLARQLFSSRFRVEACDTFGKQMMIGHVRNRHRDIMLEGMKAFCLKVSVHLNMFSHLIMKAHIDSEQETLAVIWANLRSYTNSHKSSFHFFFIHGVFLIRL
ncbi:hypothetical protein NLJ89_g6780 [Agrocybe chaxingu]|uniref:Fungal lipase-type domain-containing protein n=1 Tax=Agrocybe chaxingu TaxID=84603 RepID=A0A9W8JYI8_9AGAR|nr:hypothetical protein NLJ89_g6780 [Agrocybe chaxingu]